MEGLNVVEARQHAGAAVRDIGPEGRQIRAHVAHQVDVHREELAVFGERHPSRGDVVAALRVAHEVVGAVGGPFHRLAQFSRGDRDQGVFAIGKQFRAEAAADVRTDHPHLVLRYLQHHAAQDLAQTMAALAADRQGQMIALGVVFAHRRAGFHEVGDDARIDHGNFGNRVRLGERRFRRLLVADRHVEQDIAGMAGPDLRRILPYRIDDADRRRQRRPVDLDRLQRVARMLDGVGDDKGDGVADMTNLAVGEDRIGRAGEGVDLEIEQAGKTAEIPDVLRRQDQGDPRQAAGARGADGEFRMRMRRAQHQRVHRRLRRVIVGIAALAADQRIVFLAQDALTDAKFDGSHLVSVFPGVLSSHIAADREPAQTALATHQRPQPAPAE